MTFYCLLKSVFEGYSTKMKHSLIFGLILLPLTLMAQNNHSDEVSTTVAAKNLKKEDFAPTKQVQLSAAEQSALNGLKEIERIEHALHLKEWSNEQKDFAAEILKLNDEFYTDDRKGLENIDNITYISWMLADNDYNKEGKSAAQWKKSLIKFLSEFEIKAITE